MCPRVTYHVRVYVHVCTTLNLLHVLIYVSEGCAVLLFVFDGCGALGASLTVFLGTISVGTSS